MSFASHDHHPSLGGYDPHQVWFDGCDVCGERSKGLPMSMMELDAQKFREAWLRAFWWQHDDDTSLKLSQAEIPLLKLLWAMQVALERFYGWPVGSLPANPLPIGPNAASIHRLFRGVGEQMLDMTRLNEEMDKMKLAAGIPIPIIIDSTMPPGTVQIRTGDVVMGEITGIVPSEHNEDGGGT